MRAHRWRTALRACLTLVGLGLAGAAIFALQLGLDNNSNWGPSRKLFFGVGLALTVAAWVPGWAKWARQRSRSSHRLRVIGEAMGRVGGALARQPVVRRLSEGLTKAGGSVSNGAHRIPVLRNLVATPQRTAYSASIFIWMAALVVYVWIGSVGTWTNWPPTTSDFDLLAQGFVQGKLSLPVQPSPELLAMPDPYVMESRQFLPGLWDISYYKGKFFLYWGPVPSVLLAAVKLIAPVQVNDGLLALFFLAGLSLMAILCVLALWRRWPGGLPWWTVLPPVVALAGATPLVWLLSRGAVYEVAIASGQFFLLAGLLVVMPAFWGDPLSLRRLAAASALLALAFACRLNLALACLFVLAVGVGMTLKARHARLGQVAGTSLAAGLPMFIAVVLFGAYNQARFGSWLEFGHRFQLGRWDKYHEYSKVFGLKNAIPNFYNYFLNGVHWLNVFPYLKPEWGQYYIWLMHTYAPDGYHTEKVAGVLVVIPFLWLIGVVIVGWGRALGRVAGKRQGWAGWSEMLTGVQGAETFLIGAAVLLIAPLASFVAVSMRHEVDFVPTLGLLAAIGFWEAYRRLSLRPFSRRMVIAVAFWLALASVLTGTLLAMTGFQGNFETYNPQLFHQLTAIFSR